MRRIQRTIEHTWTRAWRTIFFNFLYYYLYYYFFLPIRPPCGPRSFVRRPARHRGLVLCYRTPCLGPLGTCSVLVTAAGCDGRRASAETLTGGHYQTTLQGMHPAVSWIHTLADSLEGRFGSGQRDVWAPPGFWGRGRLRAWCMSRQQHPQDPQALLDPLPPASFDYLVWFFLF